MSDILYLASQSKNRQSLLKRCGINYEVLRHDADECVVESSDDFDKYILAIARQKMEHAVIPEVDFVKDKKVFVITADTLLKSTITKQVLAKPVDINDAKRILRTMRQEPTVITTGCVIEKKKFVEDAWATLDKREIVVTSTVEYHVDEDLLEHYLTNCPEAFTCSGAATVEGYGDNFLKSINGSYSSAIGLPIYEVRAALKELGFKF